MNRMPRVDALIAKIKGEHGIPLEAAGEIEVLARTLETELLAAQQRIKALEASVDGLQVALNLLAATKISPKD